MPVKHTHTQLIVERMSLYFSDNRVSVPKYKRSNAEKGRTWFGLHSALRCLKVTWGPQASEALEYKSSPINRSLSLLCFPCLSSNLIKILNSSPRSPPPGRYYVDEGGQEMTIVCISLTPGFLTCLSALGALISLHLHLCQHRSLSPCLRLPTGCWKGQ